MHDRLRALLQGLVDGSADVAEVRAALAGAGFDGDLLGDDDPAADAALLLDVLDAGDAPFTASLREAFAGHDTPDVAAAVMAALAGGAEAAPVAAAVRHEAGEPPELATGLDPDAVPVAEAVRHEAGEPPELAVAFDAAAVPVAEAVVFEAGRAPELATGFDPAALPIAEAVAHEAGPVDVTAAVLAAVTDPDGLPEAWLSALLDRALPEVQHIRAAERAVVDPVCRARLARWAEVGRVLREDLAREAGPPPSLWQAVAGAIGIDDPERVPGWDESLLGEALRAEAGTIDVADAVLDRVRRDARAPEPEVPEPANGGSWTGAVVFGAMAVAAAMMLAVFVRGGPAALNDPLVQAPNVTFASAEELQIDQVRYGENASVFVEVPEDEGAPVVIWVDDGGML